MALNPFGSSATRAAPPLLTPRNLLIAGAVVNGLAVILAMALGERLIPLRVVLILTGLVLALSAVNHRLRNFFEDLEDRGTTAAYMALASFVFLLGFVASSEEWDTFRLVLGVFVGVGLVGGLLVLLPLMARRGVILFLVLLHFGGILTAVFSVSPPSGVPCWMTNTLWTYVYRPYLQFMYLNNAYHFYSPEPGPATQLWFLVSYEDPKVAPLWVQLPRRQDYPSRLAYQRATAMTESTTYQRFGYPDDMFGPNGKVAQRYKQRERIPYHPELQTDKGLFALPDLMQYREPRDLDSKKYVASYARHVARDPKYRNLDSPDTPVKSVKVYRVLHLILSAGEMGSGLSPEAPSKFLPVYMGEFDLDGNLLDPGDPLLYWVVPILNDHNAQGEPVVKNYVAVHAGSAPPFPEK
jgi:hypothetical protein